MPKVPFSLLTMSFLSNISQKHFNCYNYESPRLVINVLDNMKIKCEYYSEGCPVFRLSPTCPHLYYYTVVEKFRNQSLVCIRYKIGDYKGVQKLLDLMFVNRNCFAQNPSSDPSNVKWKVVSDQMVANGFKDWTSKKCRQGFSCALELYKKVLLFRVQCLDSNLSLTVHSADTDLLSRLRDSL